MSEPRMASDEDFQRAAAAASPITTRPSLSAYVRAARRAEGDVRAFQFPDPIPDDFIPGSREHCISRCMSLETCDEVMELLANDGVPRSVVGRVYGHTAALARVDFA